MDTKRPRMTEERRGQIALLALKDKTRREGLKLDNWRRGLGDNAKRLGITLDEASEFVEILTRELVEEAFANDGGGDPHPAERSGSDR